MIEGLTHVDEPRGRPSLTALDEVGIEVAPGEVVGLLGPNAVRPRIDDVFVNVEPT